MRIRLRPAYSAAELAALYPVPHRHDGWPDHRARVAETIELGRELGVPPVHSAIADLSCGDATIARTLAEDVPGVRLILGDLAPGYEITGPIESTISQVSQIGLFICSETVEHLDDPDLVLARIRDKAAALLLSTPLGEITPHNPEHYWGWDASGVEQMLTAAGWAPLLYREVIYAPAAYQIWGCG